SRPRYKRYISQPPAAFEPDPTSSKSEIPPHPFRAAPPLSVVPAPHPNLLWQPARATLRTFPHPDMDPRRRRGDLVVDDRRAGRRRATPNELETQRAPP